jgi:cytochrome c oxidase assembly protein subunit 15
MTIERRTRWSFQANLIAQIAIVLTGGIVRVTSSGLGCPTWPECVEGSITPTSEQTQAWHKYVEFGNRTLTGLLGIIALVALWNAWQLKRERAQTGQEPITGLIQLPILVIVGIFVQALLGGLTVLLELHPLTVAAHFMVSIGLITVAYLAKYRLAFSNPAKTTSNAVIALAGRLHLLLALAILIIGTLVTGSGPHAGDSAAAPRLPFDAQMISWLHADVVLLYLGLSLGLWFALRLVAHPATNSARNVLIIGFSQGLVGYVQYFTALPWVLVALHMLGACLVWVATLRLNLDLRR